MRPGRQRSALAAVGLAVGLAVSMGPACTPFEPTDAAPGDGGGEGGALADGGGCADLCEDFEGADWPTRWVTSGEPITATEGPSTSGTRAIDVLRPATTGPRLIAHEFRAGKVFTLTVQMRVLDAGDGEMDLVAISDASAVTGPNSGIFVVRPRERTNYVIEPSFAENRILSNKFAAFAAVTLVVDLEQRVFRYDVAGEKGEIPIADKDWKPTKLYALLGVYFEPKVTRPWHVRYDDAVITTTP